MDIFGLLADMVGLGGSGQEDPVQTLIANKRSEVIDSLNKLISGSSLSIFDILGPLASRLNRSKFTGAFALANTRVLEMSGKLATLFSRWPTQTTTSQGKLVPLDTYSVKFVEQVMIWQLSTAIDQFNRMATETKRILSGDIDDQMEAFGSRLKSAISRNSDYTKAVRDAKAQGKVAIKLPKFREDIAKVAVNFIEGEALVALAQGTFGWSGVVSTLSPLINASMFITNAANDLILKPVIRLIDRLITVTILVGGGYIGYKIYKGNKKDA